MRKLKDMNRSPKAPDEGHGKRKPCPYRKLPPYKAARTRREKPGMKDHRGLGQRAVRNPNESSWGFTDRLFRKRGLCVDVPMFGPMDLAACFENGRSGKVPADSGRKMEIKGKCGSRIALHKRGAVHKPENGLMGQPLPFGFPMRADSGARRGKAPFCLPFSFRM